MIELLPQNDGNLVAIRLIGKILHQDFETLTPVLDQQIETDGGSIRLLLDLSAFDGWEDLHAVWNHFILVKNHHKQVERIAVVGDEDWERRLAELLVRFKVADVGYYTLDRMEAACEWLAS